MKFKDLHVNKEYRFSLGQELESGRFYLSIPVSNKMVDYEEYYEVHKTIISEYPSNIEEVINIKNQCINHENDNALLIQPGSDRGAG